MSETQDMMAKIESLITELKAVAEKQKKIDKFTKAIYWMVIITWACILMLFILHFMQQHLISQIVFIDNSQMQLIYKIMNVLGVS